MGNSKLFVTALLILAVTATISLARRPRRLGPKVSVRLVKVSDGDTITVYVGTKRSRVRFLYIDAPEKSQSFGNDSLNFLKSKLIGETDLKIAIAGKDYFKRLLAVVYAGGENVNRLLVEQGMAWCYKNRCPRSYKAALRRAQSLRRGLWQDDRPVAPWTYRKLQKKARRRSQRHRNSGF